MDRYNHTPRHRNQDSRNPPSTRGGATGYRPKDDRTTRPSTRSDSAETSDYSDLIANISKCSISRDRNSAKAQGKVSARSSDRITWPATNKAAALDALEARETEAKILAEEEEEDNRLRCHGTAVSTGERCRWMCDDQWDLPTNGKYYCKYHDPRRRCQGKSVTNDNKPCARICSEVTFVEEGARYYCYQHDPSKTGLQCNGYAKTKDRRCNIICRPSQIYRGKAYCNYHWPA